MFKKLEKYRKISTVLAAAFVLSFAGTGSSLAASNSAATGPALDLMTKEQAVTTPTAYQGDVNTLQAAKEASQLLVMVGNEADPAKGTLTWYQRDAEGLLKPILSMEAVSGMNGITTEKQEGDMKTPAGVYSFSMAFGMKENPGAILPYHQVVEGDHFVDDSASRYYNRLVNEKEVEKDWNSSEVLIRQAPHYNYALVLNYNEACVPGKGSAIFLHCPKIANNTGTSGCISVQEEQMKQILCSVDAATKIVVVQKEADLASY